jgi:hypothetical protein
MATSDILPTPEAIWSGRTLTIVMPAARKPRKARSAKRIRKPVAKKGKRK